jgi:hypothetical protein
MTALHTAAIGFSGIDIAAIVLIAICALGLAVDAWLGS